MLENFDRNLAEFNERNGRLRISITPSCNLACTFCHTEGNQDHGAPKYMDPSTFENLVSTFEDLGGREVNITGGEPLLHPALTRILSSINNRSFRTTVSTNGFPLKRIISSAQTYDIDQFKISLHTTQSDQRAKALLGRAWNYQLLKTNIQGIRERGYSVILNYTLSNDTFADLSSVIESSIELGCDLKIIDLEEMAHAPYHNFGRLPSFFQERVISPSRAISTIERFATFDEAMNKQTGSTLFRYRTPEGTIILLKNPTEGRYLTDMCIDCSKKDICSEGIFALRVNTNGTYIPCILRQDTNIQSPDSYEYPVSNVRDTMSKAIQQLMTGDFTTK
jgi:GTP 3',8-cyclase